MCALKSAKLFHSLDYGHLGFLFLNAGVSSVTVGIHFWLFLVQDLCRQRMAGSSAGGDGNRQSLRGSDHSDDDQISPLKSDVVTSAAGQSDRLRSPRSSTSSW